MMSGQLPKTQYFLPEVAIETSKKRRFYRASIDPSLQKSSLTEQRCKQLRRRTDKNHILHHRLQREGRQQPPATKVIKIVAD